jgi:hypothetical protein
MFRTTAVNFDPNTAQANAEFGAQEVGELSSAELRELLETFRGIDPIQNVEADPEVHIEARRARYVVRTGQNRLLFSDPRKMLEPALVLSPEAIIAELDGSAAAARTRGPFVLPPPVPTEPVLQKASVPTVSALRLPHRIACAVAAVLLAGYIAYPTLSAETVPPPPHFTPFTDAAQEEAQRALVAGVYMTGPQPGQYGIALGADGSLRLFQVNAQVSPSLIQDSYRLGRIGTTLYVLSGQPGGPIRVNEGNTLTFCGEIYQRIP